MTLLGFLLLATQKSWYVRAHMNALSLCFIPYEDSLSLIVRKDTKSLVAGAYQHARHCGNRTMVEQRAIVTQRSVHIRSQHLTWLFVRGRAGV